ncbi:hypothetical protein COV42_00225 [Candidatus Campbellbacteria bacterium CG11_big_fil_rev_8_21_14_0_20_44_21]|uniref:Uncharacterized protein n=1 Tax=Candidatus Campbellbacteria bacterium CG22_combo_CG10-13_8_21_14_all_43_18 TaxID=1974530 RepID=A0A2H0DWQ8_9BACT|nr:MAG: hypothetical protein COW82_01165 [Candidatus Campbellbacteria bacterium CG22_combo_CG10-13_8_21_14_all_43_18]PIR24503.1 MAG: hypothetical protein COV42_00225 [Candidatus Campbellbacteria bacterium CG11_big_fil_rev_8_21_14_0_20_44_21]
MKKIFRISVVNLALLLVPYFALAAADNVNELIVILSGIVRSLILLAVAMALLYFFWGLALFIKNTGSGSEAEEARQKMLWGIIALFVMVSVWGIVQVLNTTFVRKGQAPQDIQNAIPFNDSL